MHERAAVTEVPRYRHVFGIFAEGLAAPCLLRCASEGNLAERGLGPTAGMLCVDLQANPFDPRRGLAKGARVVRRNVSSFIQPLVQILWA
jgi:hypothetical protein